MEFPRATGAHREGRRRTPRPGRETRGPLERACWPCGGRRRLRQACRRRTCSGDTCKTFFARRESGKGAAPTMRIRRAAQRGRRTSARRRIEPRLHRRPESTLWALTLNYCSSAAALQEAPRSAPFGTLSHHISTRSVTACEPGACSLQHVSAWSELLCRARRPRGTVRARRASFSAGESYHSGSCLSLWASAQKCCSAGARQLIADTAHL